MIKKVMLVDDDEGVLALLSATLEREGILTYCTDGAQKALKKLSEEFFPVVITDIMMPDMDGLELLEKIKEISSDTQVIMITAYATLDSAITALKRSAASYIKKPFDPDELVSQTNAAFDKYGLLEENKKMIEELRYAKEYNEEIIDHLVYTLLVIDENGNITKMNRAMEDLLGYTQKELAGKPADIIFSKDFKDRKWNELGNVKKLMNFPVTFLSKEGRPIEVLFTGTLMKSKEGKILGLIGTTKSQKEG
ncbi:MAG: response regulator [Endomicrobiales bacterium]|nr:response regulator [Endomicrobiales bacterium]